MNQIRRILIKIVDLFMIIVQESMIKAINCE